jgi:ribosome biogenesis GTPase
MDGPISLARAFEPHARAGHVPGRVVVQQRNGYLVATDEGELRAKPSGRLRHEAGRPAIRPSATGWRCR